MLNPEIESINTAYSTLNELIKSDEFLRWLGIIIDNENSYAEGDDSYEMYNKDTILLYFKKIQKGEPLTSLEKGSVIRFISDKRIERLLRTLLNHLKYTPINVKTNEFDDLYSFSELLKSIYAEDGYEKVQQCIIDVVNNTQRTLAA